MINRNQTQEQLLKSAIRSIVRESLVQKKASRIRRLTVQPRLSEDYVVRVLGFSRTMLVESKRDIVLEGEIIVEHLIFEGFWSDAKDKLIDKLKNNPLKDVADAIKRFGNGVDGVVAALTAVVDAGGDAMETLVSGAKGLMSKSTSAISRTLKGMAAKIKELASKAGFESAAERVSKKIDEFIGWYVGKIDEITSESGWKGMMGTIVAFLAVQASRSKLGVIVDAALKALTGDADKMLSSVMNVKSQVDDAVGEESESPRASGGEGVDIAGQALEAAWESVKNLVWGLMEKAVGAAGAEAIAQVAGPVMWIKKLGEVFKTVAGGAAWVCEEIVKALDRGVPVKFSATGKKEASSESSA